MYKKLLIPALIVASISSIAVAQDRSTDDKNRGDNTQRGNSTITNQYRPNKFPGGNNHSNGAQGSASTATDARGMNIFLIVFMEIILIVQSRVATQPMIPITAPTNIVPTISPEVTIADQIIALDIRKKRMIAALGHAMICARAAICRMSIGINNMSYGTGTGII